ncbi:MAG: DUF3352 domain-containing protein [Chloroflexi bacterium]|nr:MAG: DUF3352 domain-containing protein [Chloroflexota bacterium]MBL1193975.1 DUF3352 domain-containing protein [Chloroflexota bacterium]NOH11269.1 DUF3352 domain-containing protein [Chloroflexota bacterium]
MSENITENETENKSNNKLILGGLGIAGVLGVMLLCGIAALLWFFWPRLFGGGDPIAERIPNDAVIYMNVDLLNMQSENFQDLMLVFQEMAEPDQDKTLVETLDEQMGDLVNMNFTDDVLPWIGQYGGLAILDLDLESGDGEYIWLVETRDKTAADQFISSLAVALDDEQGMQFSKSEKEGIEIYTHEPDFGEDLLIARVGNFVYFSNSEAVILDSAALDKKDSLASLKIFEDAHAELPNDRVASAFFSNALYSEVFDMMAAQYYMTDVNNLDDIPLGGFAMSMSADDAGLRFDFAVAYNEDDLSEFEKEAYTADYLAPKTDDLVPADTFFYLGTNQSHDPSFYLQEGNPLLDADTEEALELLNDEYGIDIMEFINFLSGEFAFAMGPSREGFISDQLDTDIGFTAFISTHDESGFSNWFEDVLKVIEDVTYTGIQLDDISIEGYELHEMTMGDEEFPSSMISMVYGADNGYIILGSSQDILEEGLGSNPSLAESEIYLNTWEAFPSGSVPYMFINMTELIDSFKDANPYMADSFQEIDSSLDKIPVVALAINETTGYTQAFTLIIFVEGDQ